MKIDLEYGPEFENKIKINFCFAVLCLTKFLGFSNVLQFAIMNDFKPTFSILTKMLGKHQAAFSPNLNFLRLTSYQILNNSVFPLT